MNVRIKIDIGPTTRYTVYTLEVSGRISETTALTDSGLRTLAKTHLDMGRNVFTSVFESGRTRSIEGSAVMTESLRTGAR